MNTELQEASLSRVWQHTKSDRPFAILTAFRGEFDKATNVRRNKALAANLRKSGYGYFFVDGYWIENEGTPEEVKVSEDSIFVIGKAGDDDKFLKEIIAQGVKYNQDAVLVKTSDGVNLYDKAGKVMFSVGSLKPGKLGDIYTRLRNNKKSNTFVFESTRTATGFIKRLMGND